MKLHQLAILKHFSVRSPAHCMLGISSCILAPLNSTYFISCAHCDTILLILQTLHLWLFHFWRQEMLQHHSVTIAFTIVLLSHSSSKKKGPIMFPALMPHHTVIFELPNIGDFVYSLLCSGRNTLRWSL